MSFDDDESKLLKREKLKVQNRSPIGDLFFVVTQEHPAGDFTNRVSDPICMAVIQLAVFMSHRNDMLRRTGRFICPLSAALRRSREEGR